MTAGDPAASGRMDGGGYYTQHSESQQLFGALGVEWFAEAASQVPPPPGELCLTRCPVRHRHW